MNLQYYQELVLYLSQVLSLATALPTKHIGFGKGGTVERTIDEMEFVYKEVLPRVKIYEIDKDLTFMLQRTKCFRRPVRLPFPTMYIETTLSNFMPYLEGMHHYMGLLIWENPWSSVSIDPPLLENIMGYKEGFPNISIFSVIMTNQLRGHLKCSLYTYDPSQGVYTVGFDNLKLTAKAIRDMRKEWHLLSGFVLNFLDFIQNKEVEIITMKRSKESGERRVRHGKIPLPPSNIVRVKGHLREYVDKLRRGKSFNYSHKFWVSGHWRRLESEWYARRRGDVIWIPPFVKGSGLLIDKRYEVVDKKDQTRETASC